MNSNGIRVIFFYNRKRSNNAAKAKLGGLLREYCEWSKSGVVIFSLQNEPRGRPTASLKNHAPWVLVETDQIVFIRKEDNHTTI